MNGKTISALSVLLAIVCDNLENITKDMGEREKNRVYDLFEANVRELRATNPNPDAKVYNYGLGRAYTDSEIRRRVEY